MGWPRSSSSPASGYGLGDPNRWCATDRDYSPACSTKLLASRTSSERGSISGSDGWIAPAPPTQRGAGGAGRESTSPAGVLSTWALAARNFFRQLTHDGLTEAELKAALWE